MAQRGFRGINAWFTPGATVDLWLACSAQGNTEELHRQGMLLLMTEHGSEVVSIACELWRRTALHEDRVADLLMGGFEAWVHGAAEPPAEAERFLRWVLDELERATIPAALPLESIPEQWHRPLAVRHRVQGWACHQLIALARSSGDEDRLRRAEAVAFAVYAQMHASFAPPAAAAFLAAHPHPALEVSAADAPTAELPLQPSPQANVSA